MQKLLSMSAVLLVCVACTDGNANKVAPMAEKAASEVRDKWKSIRKPIEIELAGYSEQELKQIQKLGIHVNKTMEMTEEEYESLAGVPFTLQGSKFMSEHPNVMLSDSAAQLLICYPYRKDLTDWDTLHLKAPFSEQLYGKELERHIGDAIAVKAELKSSVALMRICIESDNLHDRLDALQVSGEPICTAADYFAYEGKWVNRQGVGGTIAATDANCLLNNGRQHDFYLIPTDSAATLTVTAKVNGKNFTMKTAVPPLLARSLTRLGLKLNKGNLQAGSSWVETQRKLSLPTTAGMDSIQIGYYLQADGAIRSSYDAAAVAVVVETDGKHGKAIALTDCEGEQCYGSKQLASGKTFATVDGKRKEGIINPKKEYAVSDAETIVFKPKMPYNNNCALGYTDGATLTQAKMQKPTDGIFKAISEHKGSYIPSLGELAKLYYMMQPYSKMTLPDNFEPPTGIYLSSSEMPNNSIYTIDLSTGAVTGISKAYGKAKLRLFYLF
jgi:hypothetical protein